MRSIDLSVPIHTIGASLVYRFYEYLRTITSEYIGIFSDGCQNTLFVPTNLKLEELITVLEIFYEDMSEYFPNSKLKLLAFIKYIKTSFINKEKNINLFNIISK